jgi:hypothetical protein
LLMARSLIVLLALLGLQGSTTQLAAQGPAASEPIAELSDAQLQAALGAGAAYKSGKKYFEAARKDGTCKWSGSMAMDGIAKRIVFLSGADLVAGASAQARAELRTFGLAEARALATPDALFAVVLMEARGMIGRDKLAKRYAGGIHLVLNVAGVMVQPVGEDEPTTGPTGPQSSLYTWYTAGGMTYLNQAPLGAEGFQQGFVFPVPLAKVPNDVRVIAVDGEGDRKELTCSLRGLR